MARTAEVNAFLTDLQTNHPDDYAAFVAANTKLADTLAKGTPFLYIQELQASKAALEAITGQYAEKHPVAIGQLSAKAKELGDKLLTGASADTNDIAGIRELASPPAVDAAKVAAEATKAAEQAKINKELADKAAAAKDNGGDEQVEEAGLGAGFMAMIKNFFVKLFPGLANMFAVFEPEAVKPTVSAATPAPQVAASTTPAPEAAKQADPLQDMMSKLSKLFTDSGLNTAVDADKTKKQVIAAVPTVGGAAKG